MKKSILVAIEDVSLRKLIRRRLISSAYKVVGVSTMDGIVKALTRNNIDLILVDIRLSDPDGLEKACWKDHPVPCVIISGFENEVEAREMKTKGAREVLPLDAGFFSSLPVKLNKIFREIANEQKLQVSLAALHESEDAIKSILDTLRDPVFIRSEDNQIEYTNAALQSLIGNRIHEKKCYRAVFNSSVQCEYCPSVGSQSNHSLTNPVELLTENEHKFFHVSISPINFRNEPNSWLHILKDVTELIKIKDEAEENENKFRLVAENAIDMVWQMDLRLKFTYLSPSAEKILGFRIDEMVGRNLWEFARRKDFIYMSRQALGAIRDYRNFTYKIFETKLIRKNGEVIPVEITGKLLKDQNGKLIGLQGSTKDISERYAVQNELNKQHTLLRTLIDNIPDHIYVKDLSSRYILNNSGHQNELLVTSQEELLHKTDHDFYDEEAAGEFYRDEQKIIDSGVPIINKEEFISSKDGSDKWTLTTKVPIRDEKGIVTGIAGINRDITKRKIIEDDLLKSRNELALRNKIASIFLTTGTYDLFHEVLKVIQDEFISSIGYFAYINNNQELVCPTIPRSGTEEGSDSGASLVIPRSSWEGVWGKSLQEKRSIYENQDQLFPFAEIACTSILSVTLSIKNELLGQICIGNKPGGYNETDQRLLESVAVYIAPILHSFLNEGRMKQAKEEAFLQLKKAKEKAEESDQLKSAFLLNLSHELRTPLNAIIGFSNVLVNQNNGQENSSFYAEHIHSAGNDLMKMVEDTISMAKLESGQIELDPVKERLGKTLEDVKLDFLTKNKGLYPGIEIHLDDRTHEISLHTDHELLKNALYNILDNAMKFSGKGPVKLGGYKVNGSQVILYVEDTGAGIPEDLQQAVFEKFRKLETKENLHRGSGLGLSISKGLVERIGGTVQLESQVGMGTCVRISLPLTQDLL